VEANSNNLVASAGWAVEVPEQEASAASVLRLRADVLACRAGGKLWLRGQAFDEPLEQALKRLAPAKHFRLESDGSLIPLGRLLPIARLPDGPWVPLKELVIASRPPAALPAQLSNRLSIQIIRSAHERPATLVRTSLKAWVAYAESAPLVRLKSLHFAASDDDALIRGTLLPPLQGIHYYEVGGLVVPCGFTWSPAIDAQTLREVLKLSDGDLALFDDTGRCQQLPATSFVRATRSAARLTLRGSST
jgi:hypothetical protein